ncbi:MAG: IS66 family insertion sequence element accessory protein TnpB, partial [Hungatella sp.]|nr:IS66 family insertion sequence element accessory protein TnpB [Hungatella sp.]
MDTITHEVRESHWKSVIEQCQQRPEGISGRSWMQENGISEKSYNYWLRKMRQKAYEQITS